MTKVGLAGALVAVLATADLLAGHPSAVARGVPSIVEGAKAEAQAAGADPDAVRRAADDSIRAMMLIRTYRVRGHLAANLDPLGLHRGEIPADLPDPVLGERLGRLRVHLVAGTRDRLVSDAVVLHQEERLRRAGVDPRVHRFDGGHRLDPAVLRAIAGGD